MISERDSNPVHPAFDNQLTACGLWSQVLQYVSILNEWDVNSRPRENSRVDPVRGDILETICGRDGVCAR